MSKELVHNLADAQALRDMNVICSLYEEQNLTFEDVSSDRALVVWRIVREIGRLTGQVNPNEPLAEAQGLEPEDVTHDPWRYLKDLPDLSPNEIRQLGGLDVLKPIYTYRLLDDEFLPNSHKGFPLLPHAIITREAKDAWKQGCISIVNRLQLWIGSLDLPHYGRRGLAGILDPKIEDFRTLWPSPREILEVELAILEATKDVFLSEGEVELKRYGSDRLGLTTMENRSLLLLTRKYISSSRLEMTNKEDDKRILEQRLETYLMDAKKNGSYRAELNAIKLMANVQGLTRTSASSTEDNLETWLSDAALKVIDLDEEED